MTTQGDTNEYQIIWYLSNGPQTHKGQIPRAVVSGIGKHFQADLVDMMVSP